MIQNIIFVGIVAFLMFILYKTWANGQKKEQKKSSKFPEKLKFISGKTGRVIEMRLIDDNLENLTEKIGDEAFLLQAQMAFQQITESFSKGNLSLLKKVLEEPVYRVFAEQIRSREEKKQILDFSIVCIDSAKITHKSESKDEITVEFISEQINVLKDEKGTAIEGDPMNIATIKDKWIFKKANKNKWLLSATQSEVA